MKVSLQTESCVHSSEDSQKKYPTMRAEHDLKNLIIDLLDELKDVFREEDIRMIDMTRPLTDWTVLAILIKQRTLPVVPALQKAMYADNCVKVSRSSKAVGKEEFQDQFYKFVKRLEKGFQRTHKSVFFLTTTL